MPPLVIEGDTLGKRQQHYNKIVKNIIAEEVPSKKPEKINPDGGDLENLLKIDVASNNKDVEYILEVLKSEDMLYVSRAIKRCTWLFTNQQYAHIINPEYLNGQLFPQMTSKACSKLMLHIRLNLRDESRAEAFYNHFKDNDPKTAFKWLPYCSLSFIEKEVKTHSEKIVRDLPLIKRLCERSFKFLKMLCEVDSNCYYKREISQATMFLINAHTEEYLDVTETFEPYYRPCFGAKATAVIMKKCPQRITDSFDKYADKIDLETFVKHLKKEDIKDFLLKHVENEKLQAWFVFDNLKHFACNMPKEGRFDFLKKSFIEKVQKDDGDKIVPYESDDCSLKLCCAMSNSAPTSSANIYRWYRFAPFDVAFPDLKKLIRSESSPFERNAMLAVLISCAGRNLQHIQTVLQYYHDKHINEPFKFKSQFINIVLSLTDTHKYDEKTWNILNNIFCSMEVYIESNNNVQSCIESIIIYKVLHNEKVPDMIEKKFKFTSLKSKQGKYNNEQKEMIFDYLQNFLRNKMLSTNIRNESELQQSVTQLEDVVSLLTDWKKDLVDYPWVLNLIKSFSMIQKQNNWKVDLLRLFNKKKSWRKLMFEDSLVMSPSEETCLNALKHDPEILTRYKSEVEALRRNDAVSLRRLLSKLRIYWPQSLASEWSESYLQRLHDTSGHESLTIGLCTLLPQKPLLEIIKKYAPTETKINWSDNDELVLSLRKHIAKNAHLARPLLPPHQILPYAQGDYLQYALPSLCAILYNVSSVRSREYIPKLLDAPVSLQKHGIRLAFTKLNATELKETLPNIWKSAKNLTIRAVLFKTTYDLLCKEKNPSMIEEIWQILSTFIDNLSSDENKVIFGILGKVDKVPLLIRGQYCMKSYKYLKSLPAKANCDTIVQRVLDYTNEIMEYLDEDFVANILLDSLEKKFTTKLYNVGTMTSYLLCAKTEVSQTHRYEKILAPLLDLSFTLWNVKVEENYPVRRNITQLLKHFCRDLTKYIFEKDMVYPTKMFTSILKKLEGKLSIEHHYVLMRYWKLTVRFVEILEEHKELVSTIRKSDSKLPRDKYYNARADKTWNEIYTKASAKFAESCLQYLREDIKTYCPSVWLALADALEEMFNNFEMNPEASSHFIKSLLREEFVESYLLALKASPSSYYLTTEEENATFKEIRKIIYSHPSPEVKLHYCREFDTLNEDFESNIPMK